MLIRRQRFVVVMSLSLLFILSSCDNSGVSWRKTRLVAQLYRQYKEEVLLAYSDVKNERVIAHQPGYARAYFDNYRKEIIFTKDRVLEYLVHGEAVSTATDVVTGYPADILLNDTYQLAVEILDVQADNLTSNEFDGAKSRVIDLKTGANVVVDGLLFNRSLLVGHYFYGFTFDNERNQLFDIVDLTTMEHKRIKNKAHKISFIYVINDTVYVQVASKETAFRLDGFNFVEERERYRPELPNFIHGAEVLKDVAPRNNGEHWYISTREQEEVVGDVQLLRIQTDGAVQTQAITLPRADVVQVIDVSEYVKNQIALFLLAKDKTGALHAIISVHGLDGVQKQQEEITDLFAGDVGRFTALGYIE